MDAYWAAKDQERLEVENITAGYAGDFALWVAQGNQQLTFKHFITHR